MSQKLRAVHELATRVLLIGWRSLELMRALIRRGCIGVSACRPGGRPEAAPADLVLVPNAASFDCPDFDCPDTVIAQAMQALVPPDGLLLRSELALLGRLTAASA